MRNMPSIFSIYKSSTNLAKSTFFAVLLINIIVVMLILIYEHTYKKWSLTASIIFAVIVDVLIDLIYFVGPSALFWAFLSPFGW